MILGSHSIERGGRWDDWVLDGDAVWPFVILVGIGATLRLVQFAANASLWLDEVALVKGIVDLNVSQLITQPLPYDQVAPKGFLLVQKLAVTTLGSTDWVLRLFPFVCSLLSLALFARLMRRTMQRAVALVAVLLFAVAAPLIFFAGMAKQYSTDVCVALALWSLAFALLERKRNGPSWTIAMTGAALLWFSQPAVIVAVALATTLIVVTRRDAWNVRRSVWVVAACWITSALLAAAAALATMRPETNEYMRVYWAVGLAPSTIQQWLTTRWPWPAIKALFGTAPAMIAGLGYPLSSWYAVLCGLGLLWLGLSKPRVAAVLLSPAVATFAAAVARQYPFSDRLIMFLLPVVCAGMAVAIVEAGRLASRGAHFVGALVLLALAVPPLVPVAARLPPYRLEEMKPVLSYISSRRNPNDAMYIYYAAAPALSIYDRSFAIGRNNYVVGGCHQGDTRRYLEELDTFRGQARIWIIFSHLLPVNPESEDIKGYLDAIGHRVDYVRADSRMAVDRNPPRVEAALYDLSDAARLGGAEARTFRVTERRKANERSCTNGPQVMIPSDFDCRAGHPCERRAKK